jgi:hypothetical protein
MGDEISASSYSREERQRYREKVQLCLDVFERMLSSATFESDGENPLTGLEVELNLVDLERQPFLGNAAVLEEIADPLFQTELGAYNIEMNVPPRPLKGDAALGLEDDLRASLNHAEEMAGRRGAEIVMVGILPTLMTEHLARPDWMSPSPRYTALNDMVFAARGEDVHLDIHGVERLSLYASTLAPESACTSVQLHLQVAPTDFAKHWNAAQVLAGPQVALGANSPFFFGRELWHETRIELFAQSTDTRPQELKNQGVRPRVWFGERWITSIFDLFEENVHSAHPVGRHRAQDLAGEQVRCDGAAGAGRTAGRHDDDVVRIEEPGGQTRRQGEAHGGRVTARDRDPARPREVCARPGPVGEGQFRQAVGPRPGVLTTVELGPGGGIAQPVVGPAVDHHDIGRQGRGKRGAGTVRQGEHDDVVPGERLDGGLGQHPVGERYEPAMVLTERGAGAGGGGDGTDLQLRVAERETEHLTAGVPAGARDRDRPHVA